MREFLEKHRGTFHGGLARVRSAIRVPLSKRLARLSDHFELAGIGCLVGAAWWWVPIIGLVALGVALIYIGWVTHESS